MLRTCGTASSSSSSSFPARSLPASQRRAGTGPGSTAPAQARPRLHGPGLTVSPGLGGEEGGTQPRLLGAGNMAGAGPCPRPAGRA